MQLWAMIVKELRLVGRDIHGLALLFVMPVVFILIMSLAMKADFDRRSGVQLDVLVLDQADSPASHALLQSLRENSTFRLLTSADAAAAEAQVATDSVHFLLVLASSQGDDQVQLMARVLIAPGNSPEFNQLFLASVRAAAGNSHLQALQAQLQTQLPELAESDLFTEITDADWLTVRYAGGEAREAEQAPTSVQQNVPAWLVFSMFFVVVPLANTLINERQLGTLRRLRTIAVPTWMLVAGKLIPYFVINQLQVVAMLLVGIHLVPQLGGDQLTLGEQPLALIPVAAALSIAALGFGLLIAVVAKTTEQATTLGGAGNIILAALGGIMVPAFVMPQFMQAITVVSPMSWGLQGFLDVLLRGGGWAEVALESGSLLGLGVLMIGAAILLLYRRSD
ncbi:ABC transporter permease [Halioxenophilus sp. WMMB6]|uniref:ABC transporter permease n=1 Tax=Halioxenophilus sp. WMMB6 TaxID=3073815 RepID=UPI00295E6D7D|nr:ABC transporter permease [Halioxenophilus sp. WMMB6]